MWGSAFYLAFSLTLAGLAAGLDIDQLRKDLASQNVTAIFPDDVTYGNASQGCTLPKTALHMSLTIYRQII